MKKKSVFIFLALISLLKCDVPPANERPTSCAKNPDFKKKGKLSSLEDIYLVCKPKKEPKKEAILSLGCTYLEAYDQCVPDDSTPKCAYFGEKGCTHCWGREGKKVGKKIVKNWKIQNIGGKAGDNVNYCVDQYKPAPHPTPKKP